MSPALEEEEIADPEVFRVGTTVMYGHGGSADLLFAGFERPRNQVGCGLIRLYDGEKQVGRLEVGENAVACMGVSASGAYLVAGVTGNAPMVHEKESDFSGEGDGKLRVFDVRGGGRRTGRIPVEVFDTAQRDHNVVGFSPCEHYVYACCDPDATKRQPHTAVFDRRFARSPLLSVRDTSTTTTTTTPSRFLSTSVPQPPQPAPIRLEHAACNRGDANDGVTCAVWMRSGLFYTGGQDEVVRVWDVRRAREDMLVSVMGGMEGPISCMCVSPDEDYIAVGTTTGKVHLWTALDPIACINEWDRNAGAKTGGGGGRDWGGVTVLR
ncbi:quinon protein alcohol dehydrogenase-like superfamily [Fimicolochytrium jonesii]|uniref:quinon protein alcohol dehydrogenase-like superfamily n=1 Tax=Fimicolochytrium jonesii TaxID=1396493 RepID=UPI0022FE4EF3|nr:quinon protein alcohol dehydrogenase-like superfamily [Fimicolochytrium jonesii]KAI8817033.1 quinon protein alcohol dehydrogenase-like superfamily [Fimicolochytrium jonesii]